MKKCYRFADSSSKPLYDAYNNGHFVINRTIKDCNRSLVQEIIINDTAYLLKIPREKNRRLWQRFISIFRGSESFREFCALLKGNAETLPVPKPIFATEIKRGPFVVDSLILMEYLNGRVAEKHDITAVSNLLKKIHAKSLLHGDPHLSNFIISADNLYTIDCSLRKNFFGAYGVKREFIALEQSCGAPIDTFDKHGLPYLLSKFLDILFRIKLGWKHRKRLKQEAECV